MILLVKKLKHKNSHLLQEMCFTSSCSATTASWFPTNWMEANNPTGKPGDFKHDQLPIYFDSKLTFWNVHEIWGWPIYHQGLLKVFWSTAIENSRSVRPKSVADARSQSSTAYSAKERGIILREVVFHIYNLFLSWYLSFFCNTTPMQFKWYSMQVTQLLRANPITNVSKIWDFQVVKDHLSPDQLRMKYNLTSRWKQEKLDINLNFLSQSD